MKKENNIFELILREIAVYAAEIILAVGVIIGVLYAVNYAVELFSGLVDIGTGLLVVFIIAGLALYIDFRPEAKRQSEAHRRSASRVSAVSPSCGMVRVYSDK